MNQFIQHVKDNGLNVNGVLVTQNGKRIMEHYFVPEKRQKIHSCTKSFLCIAYGIAIEDGLLALHDNVAKYLDAEITQYAVDRKQWESVTIERLLTMSLVDLPFTCHHETNWLKYILTFPLPNVEKKELNYSNLPAYLLSVILGKASGRKTWDYLTENVLSLLDIQPTECTEYSPEGFFVGAYGMMLTINELDSLGQMYLNQGIYNDKRIVNRAWIRETMKKQSFNPKNGGYGYLMWSLEEGGAIICGMGGQVCVILPEKNAVITVLSELLDRSGQEEILHKLIWEDIYPKLV